MPSVSILMPSYNHADFLPVALASLKRQTMEDWELIAIDDGSSDDSLRVLSDEGDKRIAVYKNDVNLGTYGTLAKALSLASGNLVAIFNSDDEWDPAKLECQQTLLEKHPEAQFCYTDGQTIGLVESTSDVQGPWPRDEIQELLPFLLQENRVLASSVVFRKALVAFEASLRYSGDWEALLRPARNGPVAFVDDKLTNWRIHDRNSFVRSKRQVAEEIRLRQSILAVPEYWRTRSISEQTIRDSLSKCSMHLSALYVLEGRMPEARIAARVALSLRRSIQTLKRFAVVYLSKQTAQNRLWPDVAELGDSGPAAPIPFP